MLPTYHKPECSRKEEFHSHSQESSRSKNEQILPEVEAENSIKEGLLFLSETENDFGIFDDATFVSEESGKSEGFDSAISSDDRISYSWKSSTCRNFAEKAQRLESIRSLNKSCKTPETSKPMLKTDLPRIEKNESNEFETERMAKKCARGPQRQRSHVSGRPTAVGSNLSRPGVSATEARRRYSLKDQWQNFKGDCCENDNSKMLLMDERFRLYYSIGFIIFNLIYWFFYINRSKHG